MVTEVMNLLMHISEMCAFQKYLNFYFLHILSDKVIFSIELSLEWLGLHLFIICLVGRSTQRLNVTSRSSFRIIQNL